MPEACLNGLQWQFKTAVCFPVDAPRRIERAKRMQGVFCLAIRIDNACRYLNRHEAALDDGAMGFNLSGPCREYELAMPTGEPPFLKCVGDEWRKGNSAIA